MAAGPRSLHYHQALNCRRTVLLNLTSSCGDEVGINIDAHTHTHETSHD